MALKFLARYAFTSAGRTERSLSFSPMATPASLRVSASQSLGSAMGADTGGLAIWRRWVAAAGRSHSRIEQFHGTTDLLDVIREWREMSAPDATCAVRS